jgi:hypothetical protein
VNLISREQARAPELIAPILVIALAAMGTVYAQTPSQPPAPTPRVSGGGQQEQTQRETQQRQPPQSDDQRAVVNAFGEQPDSRPERRQDASDQNSPRSDWRDWLPNWIIAFATVVTLIVVNAQRYWAKRQAETMRQQTAAAQTAADAAMISAKVAEQTLVDANRPWLLHHTWRCSKHTDEQGRQLGYAIEAVVKNFGRSPALGASNNFGQMVMKAEEPVPVSVTAAHPENWMEATNYEKMRRNSIALAPGSTLASDPMFLSAEDCRAINAGTMRLVIHLYVEYRGVMDETVRKTHVCCYVSMVAPPDIGHDNPFRYTSGPTGHNYAT